MSQTNTPLFGTSGIRRVVNRELFELALLTGMALGQTHKKVIVGGDTRTSTAAIKNALVAGLAASGAQGFDGGIMPTPTLALAARNFEAGAMITASHNPPEYNGIKLFNPDGSGFDAGQSERIERAIYEQALNSVPWKDIKDCYHWDNLIEVHINRIMTDFPTGINAKVVVDCGCGAGSVITPYLLKRLGCEVLALNSYPSGFFSREIEPGSANLGDLRKAVISFSADVGIAHDGDADRVMAVDEKGNFISGDKLLAILAREIQAKDVVTTIDASMTIDEMGLNVLRTKVGDTYVSEELRTHGDFGGEPSGAWIFPKVSFCPDGIYGSALIASVAGKENLSCLASSIPAYPIIRGSVPSKRLVSCYGAEMNEIRRTLVNLHFGEVSDIDGLKLVFADGWCLARPSGTEPKVRITVETKTSINTQDIYHQMEGLVRTCIEKIQNEPADRLK